MHIRDAVLFVTTQVRRSFTFSSEPEEGRQFDFDPSSFFQRLQNAAMSSLFDELEGSFPELEANMRKLIRPSTGDRTEVVQPQHCQCTMSPFDPSGLCMPRK